MCWVGFEGRRLGIMMTYQTGSSGCVVYRQRCHVASRAIDVFVGRAGGRGRFADVEA